MHYLHQAIESELLNRADDFGFFEREQIASENLVGDIVEIDDTGDKMTMKNMTGSDLNNTFRKEPVTAEFGLKEVLKNSAEIIGGVLYQIYMQKALTFCSFWLRFHFQRKKKSALSWH